MASTSSVNESATVVFYEATVEGFPGSTPGAFLSVSVSGSFQNGSEYSIVLPVSANSSAVIESELDIGVSGVWGDSGASFEGKGLLTEYTISIDSPSGGVNGSIVLHAVSWTD